ncbi:ATP-binding protein [Niabella sp. 22666]|uniref:ATP-binding protein n=1 Tax=Niabella sp. 22666 TaxID=3453954 RepID=UPI003F868583
MHQLFEHTNEDQRNWIEALFDHATIGIVVTNRNGLIINFNKQAERDFGYPKEEVIHQPLEILLPPAIKSRHENYREGYYEHPTPRSMGHGRDLYAQRKDGSVFPVEVSLSSYTVNNELFVIAFVINITVRKHQEEIVIKQKEELEQITKEIKQLNVSLEKKIDDRTKMLRETLSALEQSKLELSEALKTEKDLGEMKSKFVSMASHEFKTPLSTILSSSFLLEKYNDLDEPGKRTKHINRIKYAVNDMKMILDDFLSLDKLDEGIVQAKPETLSAEACFEALNDVVYEMSVHCKPGQQILTDFKGDTPVTIDERLLKNVLINLLSNAIKFSPENSSIGLMCHIASKELLLSVKDSGIGISEEDQVHLFERFFRAKNAVNIQGTGLGLNIVLRYIELMNGSIEFKSELEKGSVFTIHIPQ